MKMQNWLVSTVLGLGLVGGTACGPQEEVVDPVPEVSQPTPQEETEERVVTAMATTTITWADFSKTTTAYEARCVTGAYNHTCYFCATNSLYSAEYSFSGCTSPSDLQHMCTTCDRQVFPVTKRVALPDGDLIDVTIEHNVAGSDVVEFRLESGSNVTWWKQVAIVGGGEYWRVWNEGGNSWCDWPSPTTSGCNINSQWTSIVTSPGTRFVFSKAKGIFATHTDMYNLYNLSEQLTGGDRVTFRWVKD
jgi:hypothetical protein